MQLTATQKEEQRIIRAIPSKGFKAVIIKLNKSLVNNKMPPIVLESKKTTVEKVIGIVKELLASDKADVIPEEFAEFYNEFIVHEPTNKKSEPEIKARYKAISDLIKTGKYTNSDIVNIISPKFPAVKKNTIRVFISHCMDIKRNRFPKLTIKGDGGKLSFSK